MLSKIAIILNDEIFDTFYPSKSPTFDMTNILCKSAIKHILKYMEFRHAKNCIYSRQQPHMLTSKTASKKSTKITLTCSHIWYYSPNDEESFFHWLETISSIIEIKSAGDTLYLTIKNQHIKDADLRELIALFYRYKIDMKQLTIFLNEKNKEWFFEKPKGYWHRKVFGVQQPPS